ncbi:hypothetical protein E3N88_27881 [Mikania micrantha]|uniref:MATH domain-containing protein n=1 Tax=Mikania micrantha TaxID=192012 RepID=A0A5N6MZ20_9ASTR|nr:hypothetical protein E3N88_27880 [Mikania micrantha]KAD4179290.1 hypothetical protein E3N88_27881 [Mikania micrantha]
MFISRRKREPTHYMLKIESFSILYEAKKSKIESDVFDASGHKWRLDIHPNKGDHISLHVVICDTGSDSKGWDVCVDVPNIHTRGDAILPANGLSANSTINGSCSAAHGFTRYSSRMRTFDTVIELLTAKSHEITQKSHEITQISVMHIICSENSLQSYPDVYKTIMRKGVVRNSLDVTQ